MSYPQTVRACSWRGSGFAATLLFVTSLSASPVPPLPVLSAEQGAQLGKAVEAQYGAAPSLDWFTDPEELLSNAERRTFVEAVQKDCARMRLPQAPQIVLVEPRRDQSGKPIHSLDKLAGGWVVPGVGPILTFRAEVFGTDTSLLNRQEALGVIAHELFHIAACFKRGSLLPDYDVPSVFRSPAENARIAARARPVAQARRQEESAADRNTVRLGRGSAFLSGLDKLVQYTREVLEANPIEYNYPAGATYADVLNQEGRLADHPLDPTRRINLIRAIEKQNRKTKAGTR